MNMKFNKYNTLTLFLFFLLPILSLPGIFRSMLAGERFGYFMLSLFLGLLAYLMVPYDTLDLTRYYADFNYIKDHNLSLKEVVYADKADLKGTSHSLINLFMWLVNFIGLPKEAVPLVIVGVSYYLYFLLLLFIIKDIPKGEKSLSTKSFIIIFAFIIFNEVRFVDATSGLRNELAFSLSLLATYLLLTRKRIVLGWFLLLFSVLVHSASLILILVFLLSKIKPLHKLFRVLFLLSIVIIITGASSYLFYSTMDLMKPYLILNDAYRPAYFSRDGVWGGAFWDSFNLKTIVLEKYIKPLAFYVSATYLVIVRSSSPDYRRFLYLMFFLVSVVSISRTLFDRYAFFSVMLFIVILMIELRSKPLTKAKKIFLVFFISSLLIMDVAGLYKYRAIYLTSWGKMLYTPTPILLLEKVEINEYLKR